MRAQLTAILLLITVLGWTQKPFQGTVVYSLTASGEKEKAELTVCFAPQKILMKFKESTDFNPNYTIVDLDSGKLYLINDQNKTYRVRNLVREKKPTPVEERTIMGFNTSAVTYTQSSSPGILKNLMNGDLVIFVSKEHYYPIKGMYANVPELMFVHKDHIVLGGKITMANQFGDMYDEEEEDVFPAQMEITAEAIKIEPGVFTKEELSVPKDYTRAKRSYMPTDTTMPDVVMTDTVMVRMDSVQVHDVPEPAPDKNKKKQDQPEKAIPPKAEAEKRKKT